jgi:hypothetical protein
MSTYEPKPSPYTTRRAIKSLLLFAHRFGQIDIIYFRDFLKYMEIEKMGGLDPSAELLWEGV